MIVLVVTFGRLWCTICPMELLHRVGDGLARRIGHRCARLTPWLRAGWMTLLLYLTLQLLVAGVSIHRGDSGAPPRNARFDHSNARVNEA